MPADQPVAQTTSKPTRRQRTEALAMWLSGVCIDWPPIGHDWRGKDAPSAQRRKAMRRLAREAMKVAQGEEHVGDAW